MLGHVDKTAAKNKLVAVAIDRDKGSQGAMKWAVDYVLNKGQTVLLLHVKLKSSGSSNSSPALPTFSMSMIFAKYSCMSVSLGYLCKNFGWFYMMIPENFHIHYSHQLIS